MFKLFKIEDVYLLTDRNIEKIAENQFSAPLYGSTTKIEGADKILLLEISKIDPFILNDKENNEWDVELDHDNNIYLQEQTI